MTENEIRALISLLDDDDPEVAVLVEQQIKKLGNEAIPVLENQWQENGLNADLQQKIENIIHELNFSKVLERLERWKNNDDRSLLEGLWIIATYQYPDLALEYLQKKIYDIYFDVWLEMRETIHPHDEVRLLNQVFFEKYKFAPNTKNFHSPTNSMLNQVLETKKGNPISLCIIYLLVAQKLGMKVYGVNLPNLFVLTYKNDKTQFYINVFNRGIIFAKKDIDDFIKQLNLEPKDIFYEPCTNLDIIRRVLRNLIISFEKSAEPEKAKEIDQLLKLFL